jgi:D-alanyl-D-alanine carboxypeptidase/D-alanyl-D-alanine-endopeptidase (penicillin-binding protein 4)
MRGDFGRSFDGRAVVRTMLAMGRVSPVTRTMGALALVLYATLAAAEPALQELARSIVGEGQGVYAVADDGTILVAQAANHAASVTKIATSLALLARLGPTHRFETRLRGSGPLRAGRLEGDLVVEGGGDPFLVDESALLLLRRLHTRGLRVVEGRLVARGPLLFDWQPDPDGRRLGAVLAGKAGSEARARLAELDATAESARAAALVFLGRRSTSGPGEALAVLHSPPLLHVVKALNCYSNNVFHFAADAIGGAAAVQESARAHVPEAMRDEIVIDNGAGAGATNRMSPRAAVALLGALMDELARHGDDLTAALPVSGIDHGTLEDRVTERPGIVVGKTGTFGSVGASALAGALRTRRFGVVRFAVLHHGVPVPDARARQDAFVRALIAATEAEPWPYSAATRPVYSEATAD